MKKATWFFNSILILLFISFGCSSSDDKSVSSDSSSGSTKTSFNFTLTSLKKQETASSALERQASFTADQVMTGQLTATNTVTLAVQTFDWSIYFDETTWEVQSNKTIILTPGTYDFALLLIKGDQQYAGSAAGQVISDGTFNVPMTIRPIIGDTITNVSLVGSLADFKFQYDQAELATAGFVAPQLGVIVDGGTEVVFAINASTGISDNYINLTGGSHSIQLKLYDGSLQRGRSIAAQETVIVSPGLNIAMDLVALHGETTFALTAAGGDATFSFSIPAEVVTEAGDLANLEVLFSMVGNNNPLEQNVLTLVDDGSGGYESSITLTNKQFDDITLSLTFTDTLVSEQLGSCAMQATLDTTPRTLNCDVTLRRRAIIGGSLLATLGINVFDEESEPISGAFIYMDDALIGVTNSGTFGTEGYLKVFLNTGTRTIRAEANGKYGEEIVVLTSLEIEDRDIFLNQSNMLFSEDFESQTIDGSKWSVYGSPTPSIVSGGENGDYALDPQGDGWCNSGITSNATFSMRGTSLSFGMQVNSPDLAYHDTFVGFSSNELQSGSCPEGGYGHLIRVWHGAGWSHVQYSIPGESFYETRDTLWHNYKINILESGHVEFYKDGSLMYTTTNTIDFITYPSQHIFASGRSQSYPTYIDNITLER